MMIIVGKTGICILGGRRDISTSPYIWKYGNYLVVDGDFDVTKITGIGTFRFLSFESPNTLPHELGRNPSPVFLTATESICGGWVNAFQFLVDYWGPWSPKNLESSLIFLFPSEPLALHKFACFP
jgi:hypothetical protein